MQVCPTGIDIRKGLQYECIGCGACADVCDTVMDKMGYARGLVRYTTQNGLANHWSTRQIIAHMDSDDLLMFSSDYPHNHFDTPTEALPAGLPESLLRKILAENARSFYRLG